MRRRAFAFIQGLLIAACAACLWPAGVLAQGIAVYGEVVDAGGFSVSGATVTLTPAGGSGAATTRSDPEGVSVFGNVRPGAYDLQVDASGFERWRQRMTVTDSTVQVRVTLRNDDAGGTRRAR